MLLRRADLTLAAALLGAVFAVDLLWALLEGSTGTLAYGLIDEPAHLATCAIALLAIGAAFGARPPLPFVAAALVASVAIDVDHLPGYLGSHLMTGHLPRPYTHSIGLVGVLLVLGAALRRPDQRQVALGAACGVSAHLLRDLATGPGVPLLWPFVGAAVTAPYAFYGVALLLGVGVVAITVRRRPAGRRRSRRRFAVRPLPNAGPQGGS